MQFRQQLVLTLPNLSLLKRSGPLPNRTACRRAMHADRYVMVITARKSHQDANRILYAFELQTIHEEIN